MKQLITICLISMLTLHAGAQTKDPGEQAGSTGTVTFTYLGNKTTLATVRARDGNIWLQQNLGSIELAASYDDRYAYGDLFQWGRWDDTHQLRLNPNTRNGMPEPNNPDGLDKNGANPYFYAWLRTWWRDGTDADQWNAARPQDATASNGCDPCKALGAGWRLPTVAEWDTVLRREFITDINGAIRSSLKLTAAGMRDINDYKIAADGDQGFYWSSTPASRKGHARFAEISRATVSLEYVANRSTALSVRCIKIQ